MIVLWWLFAAFYVGHVFPLVFLFTLRLNRNGRLLAQTLLSVAALWFSYEMSILLLLFTYVHAFIRTLDWTDRYAIASVSFLVADWLLPPATQPLAMILFPFLFLFWQRSLYYRQDYKRMLLTLAISLATGVMLAFIVRTIKEVIFGDLIAWIRPFFLWIGGWFDGIELDPSNRVNRFMVPDNPNLDGDNVASETLFETASNQGVFLASFFILLLAGGLFLFFYLRNRKEVHEGVSVPKQAHKAFTSEKRMLRSPKHIQLLDAGRRLEQAYPRQGEETVLEWLKRIEFVDGELFATWLEAAEYGEKDAPKPIVEAFEHKVAQAIKK